MPPNQALLHALKLATAVNDLELAPLDPLEFEPPPDVADIVDEDESDDDDTKSWDGEDRDDDYDAVIRPTRLDNVIYRFIDEFHIVKFLLNRQLRKVYGVIRKSDGKQMVIIVCRDTNRMQEQDGIPREVIMMCHVKDHPNVIDLKGWCRVDPYVYALLTDYYIGCPLETIMDSQSAIKDYMFGLLSGLKHVHSHLVAHRDIAPQNILWDPVESRSVIIDFGSSCLIRDSGFIREVGRAQFDAPEKHKVFRDLSDSNFKMQYLKPYTEAADIFSCGVVFWMLLMEHPEPPTLDVLHEDIIRIHKRRSNRGHPELDLLMSLLSYDTRKRTTLDQALNHEYFQRPANDEMKYDNVRLELVTIVKTLRSTRTLKREVKPEHSEEEAENEGDEGDEGEDDESEQEEKESEKESESDEDQQNLSSEKEESENEDDEPNSSSSSSEESEEEVEPRLAFHKEITPSAEVSPFHEKGSINLPNHTISNKMNNISDKQTEEDEVLRAFDSLYITKPCSDGDSTLKRVPVTTEESEKKPRQDVFRFNGSFDVGEQGVTSFPERKPFRNVGKSKYHS